MIGRHAYWIVADRRQPEPATGDAIRKYHFAGRPMQAQRPRAESDTRFAVTWRIFTPVQAGLLRADRDGLRPLFAIAYENVYI